MLKTSARLLRLLSLLQSRRHWTAAHLSERLEVDARTIRRDVERLRELGYPIQACAGLGGGYQLGSGSQMPPLLLNDEEAVAVAVALRAASGSVDQMEETSISLLAKLDQMLPSRLRKRASALHSVTIFFGRSVQGPSVELLTRIAAACRDHLKLKLGYRDREGKETARTVEPLRLAHTGRRWYLLAWDLDREDWRTFRVDRVQRLIGAGPRFVPREFPGDIAKYLARSISNVPLRYRMRLKLKGSLATLSKQIPTWCGMLEALDADSCVLNAGADTLETLLALMTVAGGEFEILDSHDLVSPLREIAARLGRSLQ